MTIKIFFFFHQSILFSLARDTQPYVQVSYIQSKWSHCFSLCTSFLILCPFLLEERSNFPSFFSIYLNFLDIRVTSSSMDPLELLFEPSNSIICTLRALGELFSPGVSLPRNKGSCHTLILSEDHCLSACDLRLTTSKCLTPIVVEFVKFRDVSRRNRSKTRKRKCI